MGKAWIDGAPAPFADAVLAAARRLSASRLPLVTGLRTDVAGVRAALDLARAAGGVLDHSGSDVLYRNLDALRSAGMVLGVPAEMRRRADRFLLVGGDAVRTAPDLLAYLFGGALDLGRAAGEGAARGIVWLGAADAARLPANGIATEAVPAEASAICGLVGVIRASLAGRRFDAAAPGAAKAAEIAAWLAKARFACVLWSADGLDAPTVAMLAGLVADLNAATRASAIPLEGAGQARGAAEVATWTAGYPLRIGFAGGEAVHDPFAYDGARLAASGECDLAVHVDALGRAAPAEPGWSGAIPCIALGSGPSDWRHPPAVAFEVLAAGRDHAGALYEDRTASFVAFAPAMPAGGPSAADVLGAIAEALAAIPAEGSRARC